MGGRIHYTEQRNREEMSFSRLRVSAEAASSPVPGLPSLEGRGSGRAVTVMSGPWQQAPRDLLPLCHSSSVHRRSTESEFPRRFPRRCFFLSPQEAGEIVITLCHPVMDLPHLPAQSRVLALSTGGFSKGMSHHHLSWLAFGINRTMRRWS